MSTIERSVVKGTIAGGVQIRNIFTAEVTEVGGDTSALLWDVYIDEMLSEISQLLSDQVNFYGYDVYKLTGSQWELLDEVTVNVSGQVTGEAILNAAAVVLIGKASGIRHFGRKFFGNLPESKTQSNILVGTAITAAAASLLDYISPVNGIGGGLLRPGVVDKNGGFHAFVGGSVSSLLGTMRRRKPGNGI